MDMNAKQGVLEVTDKGYGFLRNPSRNFTPDTDDVYVSARLIAEHYLREGNFIIGEVGQVRHNGQNPPLSSIVSVNGLPPEEFKDLWEIRDRIPVDPDTQLKIESSSDDHIGRAIDLICPIGLGQRGLIVAPPKVGKTTVLKQIAEGIAKNHPDVKTFAVLIDERPEEVTDFQRSTGCTVYSSSLDDRPEKHMRIARLAFAVAISEAETGKDVVVLIDSLTRMSRAFNLKSNRGKAMSGGLDSEALALPKRFFGAARNFRGEGSLSVIATILVDTGSKMDEVIFQEFKGTGNMELVLDRFMSEKRVFPAINIKESGTRKEEKLLGKNQQRISVIRRKLSSLRDIEATQELLGAISKTTTNEKFLQRIG